MSTHSPSSADCSLACLAKEPGTLQHFVGAGVALHVTTMVLRATGRVQGEVWKRARTEVREEVRKTLEREKSRGYGGPERHRGGRRSSALNSRGPRKARGLGKQLIRADKGIRCGAFCGEFRHPRQLVADGLEDDKEESAWWLDVEVKEGRVHQRRDNQGKRRRRTS